MQTHDMIALFTILFVLIVSGKFHRCYVAKDGTTVRQESLKYGKKMSIIINTV